MDNSEQWKIDGDCKICRRDAYCTKPCTLRKNRLDRLMQREIAKRVAEKRAEKEANCADC